MSTLSAIQTSSIDLTYASQCDGPLSRGFIRVVEVLTGQLKLKRLYELYQLEMRGTMDFWGAAMRLLNLSLDYDGAKLAAIPRKGPLIIVANHPFGLVDGLLIGSLTNLVRSDFKVLANARLYPPDADVQRYILPIDFDPTEEALKTNLATRATARRHIKSGGCLIIFPAGGVATTPTPFARRAIDLAQAALLADPENSRALRVIGQAALRLGDRDSAKRAFERAIIEDPRDWQSAGDLARIHHAAGETDEARSLLALLTSDNDVPSEALAVLAKDLGRIS